MISSIESMPIWFQWLIYIGYIAPLVFLWVYGLAIYAGIKWRRYVFYRHNCRSAKFKSGVTRGEALGYIIISIIPVINVLAAFATMEPVWGKFCHWLGKFLDEPL